MQTTITMGHAPAIRASRALRSINVRKMCVSTLALARRFSLTFAVICAIVSYAGILLESVIVTCTAATVALGFICLADSTQEGGNK